MPGLFPEGLIIGRKFAFQIGLGLTIKTNESSLKQLETASTNSPWANIREGLLSEGILRLRFEGLNLFFFWGGEGGLSLEFYGSQAL